MLGAADIEHAIIERNRTRRAEHADRVSGRWVMGAADLDVLERAGLWEAASVPPAPTAHQPVPAGASRGDRRDAAAQEQFHRRGD